MPRTDDHQLTLNVLPHPDARRNAQDRDELIVGELVIPKGDVGVNRDYNAGARFTVAIADEDGVAVGSYVIEVTEPRFPPLVVKDVGVVGVRRQHICKVVDE